ncbi:ribosome biogenesis factor YjgA [Motiliproteus sp. MSK22-1]|uniref:ribosome biogenesis factor YjgA n=1 Tax=Motiliproteus sp. MSK22-1 TaxID=1897630 RepID=UPI0009780EA9|nr:ribosome biogenesis factor YjgA [Motiliproteus sp. MSK22-1]OMH30449.1 hypothetical protein BGP75_18490 [Motiliproteus sp. MSK22-1]
MSDFFDDEPQDEEDIKSRTQIKREAEALQSLGKKLIGQKPEMLAKLSLSDELRAALKEAGRLRQNEAKRRHLQYIGKLMRAEDAEQIREHIERQEAGTRAYTQHFHQLENWRDLLLNDDKQIEPFVSAYPDADRQHLRQLVRNARKEAERNKPPAAARKLFKYIRDLDDNQ